MKKILVMALLAVLVVGMSVSAFAVTNGFVSSPSETPAPEVIEFEPVDEECTAQLVITPYAEKEELSSTLKTMIEKARDEVAASTDLSELNQDLAQVVADKKLKGEKLAVSDLFDIHTTGCDFHEGHVDFDVTLSAETLERFVALLHMKKDGEWELVEDARVTHDGDHLEFSVDSFSPFAIVVDTNTTDEGVPPLGVSSRMYVYAALMVASALVIAVLLAKAKKQRA